MTEQADLPGGPGPSLCAKGIGLQAVGGNIKTGVTVNWTIWRWFVAGKRRKMSDAILMIISNALLYDVQAGMRSTA